MPDPLRVLQSCGSWLATTERWLWVQVSHLPPSIESTVVAAHAVDGGDFPVRDLRVSSFPRRPGGSDWPRGVRRVIRRGLLRSAARSRGARLVHSHFGPIGWEDLSGVRSARLRQVVTFYGHDVVRLPRSDPFWRTAYRELFVSVDRVLCEGPFMASSVAKLGCPEEKLVVHRLGVELDRIGFAPRRLREGEPLRVLMAAAFVEKKGFPYGVRAVAKVSRARPVELTIVGDARSRGDAEKRRILDALAEEGIGEHVRLLGFQPHAALVREMAEHHVMLQPSIHAADGDCEGGAPVSLIDAAATGMAIVSTMHCDIPQIVSHEKTGWLAPERDVDALVAGLEWWTEKRDWEPALIAARERLEAEFDAVKQGRRLAAIYEEVARDA